MSNAGALIISRCFRNGVTRNRIKKQKSIRGKRNLNSRVWFLRYSTLDQYGRVSGFDFLPACPDPGFQV